jgi:hypothetical protein
VAHFDRAIPPGGEGKITLTVDLSGYDGPVRKDATVTSNDPRNASFTLTIKGTVKRLFQVRPGNTISFQGVADQIREASLEISARSQPFHIQKVESDLEGKVSHQLETVAEGQSYRLKVTNLIEEGNYTGTIRLTTDLPKGTSVLIRVLGRIEGKVSVNPKSISLGRLSSQEIIGSKTVSLLSNHKKPFEITNVSYDEHLVKVDVQPFSDKTGYNLVVSARMANILSGNSVVTALTVQTDLDLQKAQEVQVHLFNQIN